jgi:hypothetical protein
MMIDPVISKRMNELMAMNADGGMMNGGSDVHSHSRVSVAARSRGREGARCRVSVSSSFGVSTTRPKSDPDA